LIKGKEGSGVQHGTYRRYARGKYVIYHNRRYGYEGNHGPQDQVRERIDAAANKLMMLQDFSYLSEPGADKADQQAGNGNKDDGAQTYKAVGFGGGIKDGGKLIHQGDDAYGQKGKPDPAPMVI